MSTRDLARSINRDEKFVVEMLEEWRMRGIAVEVDGRWRLTEDGFERYGRPILNAAMFIDLAA